MKSSSSFIVGLTKNLGCGSCFGRILNSFGALLKNEAILAVFTHSSAERSNFGLIVSPFLEEGSIDARSRPGLGYFPIMIFNNNLYAPEDQSGKEKS